MAGSEWIVAGAGFLAALGTVSRELIGRDGARSRTKSDAELLALLPEESDARKMLLTHIEASIRGFVAADNSLRRDWGGTSLAVVFIVIAGALVPFVAADQPGWTKAAAVIGISFFGIFGVVGFAESVAKAERDERGRRIRGGSSL